MSVHIVCPFPPCTAEWWVGRGAGQRAFPVPFHMPQGFEGAQRYDLRCPGTAQTVYGDDDEPRELNTPTVEQMNRAYEQHLMRLAVERERVERAAEAEAPKAGPRLGFPIGRPVDHEFSTDMYFPGRPADAPEPGPGEPHPQVEIGTGHHLGRAAVDNAHSTTRGLAQLAMQEMGRVQDQLAQITDVLDRAEAQAVVAETLMSAANSLVIAAVGTGADAGAAGEAMAEQAAVAVDTIGGQAEGGNVFNAINVAKIRVEAAHQQLTAAITKATEYITTLG